VRRWVPLLAGLLLTEALWAQLPPRAKLPEVVLSNGLRVLGYQDESTQLVGVFLAVKVGASAEGTDLRGARDLLQEVFRYRLEQELRGDQRYLDLTAALLAGQGLDLNTEWDYAALVTLCPRSELRALLRVIGQVVFIEPLSASSLAFGQRQIQLHWEQYQNNPAEVTYYLFRRSLLGRKAAAQPVFAEPENLHRLTRPALEEFRARYYVPANTLLLLVGPDRPEQLVAEAVEAMMVCPRRPAPRDWLPDYEVQPANVQVATSPHLRQGRAEVASMMIGFRFPPLDDPDYAAGLVLYEMLVGPQGLLQQNNNLLRTLAVNLWGRPRLAGDPLQILGPAPSAVPYVAVHIQTAPSAIEEVRQALLGAVVWLCDQPPEALALERSKQRALNALALSGLDQQMRARYLGEWALFAGSWKPLRELPERIQAVQAADITRVAQRCFAPQYIGLQMPE